MAEACPGAEAASPAPLPAGGPGRNFFKKASFEGAGVERLAQVVLVPAGIRESLARSSSVAAGGLGPSFTHRKGAGKRERGVTAPA